MTTYNLAINRNPDFQTVNSLTNLVFDRNNVRSGRMATEDQIQQLWQDIIRLEERIDYCCRDIVYWDCQVQIRDKYGNIVSGYLENRTTGITRRGKNFIMTFPLKAVTKYESNTPVNISANDFIDNNRLLCFSDSPYDYIIKGICPLLYRGTEGQYFDMSARKTTEGLAMFYENYNLWIEHVTEDGSIQPYSSNITNMTHFATKDTNNDISIQVNYPIDTISNVKMYGRIYKFDVRDVTIGT